MSKVVPVFTHTLHIPRSYILQQFTLTANTHTVTYTVHTPSSHTAHTRIHTQLTHTAHTQLTHTHAQTHNTHTAPPGAESPHAEAPPAGAAPSFGGSLLSLLSRSLLLHVSRSLLLSINRLSPPAAQRPPVHGPPMDPYGPSIAPRASDQARTRSAPSQQQAQSPRPRGR